MGSIWGVRKLSTQRIWFCVLTLLVGVALFPSYKHWASTRTWVPVDSAVSLAPGKIRTGNFRVNLNSPYDVVIELKDYESWRAPNCQDYEVLRTRWWLSRNGRVVSTWTDYWGTERKAVPSGLYLGAFDGTAGWYNLEVE